MEKLERTILSNLIHNDEYARKVIPFINLDYFDDSSEQIICKVIIDFIAEYNKRITLDILDLEIQDRDDLTESQFKDINDIIPTLEPKEVNNDWLSDATEKWCRNRAIYLALMESIQIADGKDEKKGRDAIPHILSEALGVSFDRHVGHDYLEDFEQRWESYHKTEEKIPFDLDFFNRITKGGIPSKTLNVALAGTGVGKSLFMCHMACANMLEGKNVLYITMEMAEERIAERIDANLMNISITNLPELPKRMFEDKLASIQKKTSGKLIIKEYPTASAHSGHFRGLIKELAIKKSFKPDIVFIDYLNICASSRFKGGANINSYTIIKSIAEELRGLAVETGVPFMSATQTTRTGFVSSDIGLEDTSESFGLPATADFMFALIQTEQLQEIGQMQVKQLKNRYNDPTMYKRFVIGVDRSKMRLYDVESQAQEEIVDNGQEKLNQVFEEPSFGKDTKDKQIERFSKLKV